MKVVSINRGRLRLKMQETPVVKGRYAQQIIEEVMRKPSPESRERMKNARELLRQLRK